MLLSTLWLFLVPVTGSLWPSGYDDQFARHLMLPLAAAAYNQQPSECLRNRIPSMTVSKIFSVNCSASEPMTNCFGFTAFNTVQKAIVVSFRGSEGRAQMNEQIYAFDHEVPIPSINGTVLSYYGNGYNYLKEAGLETEIVRLKALHPDFELWLTGYSLGGSLASVASSRLVQSGIEKAGNIKLVTFGQPRTGDHDYAAWHSANIPYSFRIIHRHDLVPHVPNTTYWSHHKTEVWYDNGMRPGDPYMVCEEADGDECSNRVGNYSMTDHSPYFEKTIPVWGRSGCVPQIRSNDNTKSILIGTFPPFLILGQMSN